MVDSAEQEKLDEAKVELWRTMKYQDNKDIPLLILANKQDLQSAMCAADIEEALGKIRYCFMKLMTKEGFYNGVKEMIKHKTSTLCRKKINYRGGLLS